MISADIARIRKSLQLTQDQFAQLLGVHSLTVSKWERGKLQPSPYQTALIQSFDRAAQQEPDVGSKVATALVVMGVGVALFYLLRGAFKE